MNYDAGKLKRPITDQVRASVVEDLPEINQIKDGTLRAKAIEAWAHALCESSFQRIRDIPGEGNPGVFTLKRGSQADHLRGVARLAAKIVEEFETSFPEVRIDRDIVLTGALVHDVGKAWEFDPRNLERWKSDPDRAGEPSLRHSVFGAHVCLAVGLPEEIAHIALGHSKEGKHIGLSLECYIVRTADHSWWNLAGALGLLTAESMKNDADKMVRPRHAAAAAPAKHARAG
jgi:putative nucleotidyltransferase with HDIG domain